MPNQTNFYDCLIIGGGAAGLMCAIETGKRGKKVLVLDQSKKLGPKIKISGGGRCNFTNIQVSAQNYISKNPHFCKSALSRYTPKDFIKLVEKHRIPYHEKTLGQLFCDDTSQAIIDMLAKECKEAQVTIELEQKILELKQLQKINFNSIEANSKELQSNTLAQFEVITEFKKYLCHSLVIASGSPAIPQMGSSSLGYQWGKKFGHEIVEPQPGLVPLKALPHELSLYKYLSGTSLYSKVSFQDHHFLENVLFTHFGLSGPAILQISSYYTGKEGIKINWVPLVNLEQDIVSQKKSTPRTTLNSYMNKLLPKKFVDTWLPEDIKIKNLSDLSSKDIQFICKIFHSWIFKPVGTMGFEKSEVVVGGIDTQFISSKTFESQITPGLFFIGEVLDVTGWLGGYNFQWAWSSGWCAGQYT